MSTDSEAFVDSSGSISIASPHDQRHVEVIGFLNKKESLPHFVTTDYVLDETITLLRARGQTHLVEPWLSKVLNSQRCEVVWMEPSRFEAVRKFFAKHSDK